jgi:hypothetical protein
MPEIAQKQAQALQQTIVDQCSGKPISIVDSLKKSNL